MERETNKSSGDGELATELKELANDLQIQDKVIFLGWRDDMPVIYADLDLAKRQKGKGAKRLRG